MCRYQTQECKPSSPWLQVLGTIGISCGLEDMASLKFVGSAPPPPPPPTTTTLPTPPQVSTLLSLVEAKYHAPRKGVDANVVKRQG